MSPLSAKTTALESDPRPPMTRRLRPGDHLARAVVTEAIHEHRGSDIDPTRIFAGDTVTPLLTKAATNPATLGNAAWAGVLASQSVADFYVGLASESAASALISRGLRVSLDGFASVQVPSRLMVAADAGGFTGEGAPIQVRAMNILGGPTISPHKFAVIVAFTSEMLDRTVSDFEIIVKQMLGEASALALDAAMFSSAAAVAGVRPAGILNGVAPVAAQAGGGTTALARDIENLTAAVSASGGRDYVIVASPQKAAALKAWAGPRFDFPILASSALPAASVVLIAADMLVSGFSPTPEFRSSTESHLHFEDSSPLQLVTGAQGSGVVASPARSLFQHNLVAVRMVTKLGWALRAPGGAAHITAVTW